MEIVSRVRRWGNSFGVVIPTDVIKRRNINEGEEVIITIEKNKSIKEIFGSLKGKKLNAQRIKDDLRKEWSKW